MMNNTMQAGKLMKKLSMMIMAVLGILSLGILAGCADVLNPQLQEEDGGTGRALVRIGTRAEGARTLMPENANYDAISYTLTFTPVSGDGVETSVSVTGGETAVDLEPGTWNLSVTGQNETAALEGSVSNIEVRSGATIPVSVEMKVQTEGGDGTLSYAVTFPDAVTKGWLRVYGWDGGTLEQTVDLLETPTSGGGTKTKSGDLTLSGGYYRLGIDLYTADGVLSRNDIAHVYPGQTTAMETDYAVFETGDFVAADIHTETTLSAVLSGISSLSDGADRVYVLGAGDESIESSVSVSHGGGGSVTVTIDGGGRAVTLNGSSFISIGSGVTLKLKNIVIRGNIKVDGGTLELNDGVVISGHSGHGVHVDHVGTFTMNGGEISGNSSGGGVNIWDGTFTMNGGKISGNSDSGVYVNSGTFTMNGGEISGNTNNGGNGGGVHVNSGTFTMSGGKISGNSVSGSSMNSGNGGGVFVGFGTFTMNGGEISGNSASSSAPSVLSGNGGGVFVYYNGATFTKKGGTIYGDADATASNGAATDNTAIAGNGHAVYLDAVFNNGVPTVRNATAGPAVTLYAKYNKSNNTWGFYDASTGGVGSTAGNWEE
ncbi:MAG: right-handed parallel beta-helix repeat-containing protein [Treponema sp.]|jgi:hypothetical protein|nr:right-handed parallel beta-helix repeat-containing protein [Treponema sp.]